MLITTCSATETTLEPDTLSNLTFEVYIWCSPYLENLNPVVYSGIEINMIGTNSSCDAQFEVFCLNKISIRITINSQTQIYLLNEVTRQVPTSHDKYIQ